MSLSTVLKPGDFWQEMRWVEADSAEWAFLWNLWPMALQGDFLDKFGQWSVLVRRYNQTRESGSELPHDIMMAVVTRAAKGDLKSALTASAPSLTTWAQMVK